MWLISIKVALEKHDLVTTAEASFGDYIKAGDVGGVELELVNKRLLREI